MFTEQSLRDHPSLVKAFMGINAEQFWELIETMTSHLASSPPIRPQRPDRVRAVGGGRTGGGAGRGAAPDDAVRRC